MKRKARETPADRGAKAGRIQKPSLLFWLGLVTSLTLIVSILLMVLVFRFMLANYYMRSLRRELSGALDRLKTSGFSAEALDALEQQGIRVLLVDSDSRRIVYEDMYFLLDEAARRDENDAVTAASPNWTPGDGDARMLAAAELVRRVNGQLKDSDGFYYSTDSPDAYEQNLMQSGLKNRVLYLNGREGAYYFSLCVPIESTTTAMELASRAASLVVTVMWLLSMLAYYLLYRRITRPAKEISRIAERISKFDFSNRCPPAHTRELDRLSQSVNHISEELQDYVGRLEQSNRRLGAELEAREREQQLTRDLIGNLSHDLKTPIAIISGYAEGLAEGVADSPAQQERYLQTILKESEHMQTVVSKMLQLSRLEAGVEPVELSVFDLSELTDSVLEVFTHEIEKLGLTVERRLEEPLPVRSDYERVLQVAENYLQNSVYHVNNGAAIRVVTERRGNAAVLRVANSSAPIPAAEGADLWEKLYRGDYARARSHGEAGLGLSIVRSNMEQLGQPYGFRNLEDEGMVEFYIELPLAETEGEPAGKEDSK